MSRLFRSVLVIGGLIALANYVTDPDAERRNLTETPIAPASAPAAAPAPAQTATPVPQQKVTTTTAAASETLFVTGSRVNLRSGPSLKNQALGQLVKGTQVKRIKEDGGWSQLDTHLGRGWMASRFLSPKKPDIAEPQPKKRTVAAPTSREIRVAKENIIRQSTASYPGSCPCPYNRDRAGRRCGARSAWSRPGGYSPLCYESDVSEARLRSYFARERGAAN